MIVGSTGKLKPGWAWLTTCHPSEIADCSCWCSDIRNLTRETLEKQYERVKLRVSNNGTYNQVRFPSHPLLQYESTFG